MMNRVALSLAAASIAIALGSTLAQAAPSAGNMKRAAWTLQHNRRVACAREARAMHFGVHFIKRARFIRSCLARP
jgi:hypothetical protein